jgi:hypothetical protein
VFSSTRKFPGRTGRGPRPRPRRVGPRADDGFTLFETLIAAVVLVIGLTSLFGLLNTSLKASSATRSREGATNLAREILEDARTIPYGQISPPDIVKELQEMHGLANESGGATWQISRRGTTYTITASECAIDDPKNGWGKHINGFGENPFCKDAGEKEWVASEAAEGKTEDQQPENLKRITVDVTWAATGRSPDVHEVSTLSAAGEAPGLTAGNLHLEAPSAGVGEPTKPVITEQPISNVLTFAVSAPSATTAMRWSLEGIAQTPAPVKKAETTTWNFSWSIPYPGVSDGTYQVSVQAIDATGVVGPPVSISVTLIRGKPAAPAELRGALNEVYVEGVKKMVAELQWRANSERNVIGYRVYNPKKELVCPKLEATLSTATSCIDFNPPLPSTSSLTYSAFALYRDANGVVQKGAEATVAVAGEPLVKPSVPAKLELTKNPDGSVTLTWPAATGSPAASFYRIYRGSTNYTSRYDVATGTGTVTYNDTDAEVTHSYWVTAVTANLTESEFVGPVTG